MRMKKLWSILAIVGLIATAAPSVLAQDADRAQTLKIAVGARFEDPTNFNMTHWTGASRSDTGLHQFIYEYFFYQNLETGEYIPWLAESYEYNDDFTSMTVKLRDGVKWNDGEAFTADDVVFTYEMMKADETMAWADVVAQVVTSVEKVDDLNVKFNLVSANPRFHLNREAFPVVGVWGGITIQAQHVWEGQDPKTFKNNPPVGTGPYRLADATQTSVTYERRDDWWAKEVLGAPDGPQTIQLLNLGAETNVAFALANNEIDTPFIGLLSAGSFLAVAGRNENVTSWSSEQPYSWADPCPRLLLVNNEGALNTPELRWAVSNLIDRDAVVDLAYEGATTPLWGLWPEYSGNQPYFESLQDLRDQYQPGTTDEAKAQQFFEQAGVDPSSLKLRYVVNAESNEDVKATQVVADQLSAAGIDVEVQPLTGSVLADTTLRGDYDLKQNSFCPGSIVENLDLFNAKYYKPLGEAVGLYERNSFRYNNPEFSAIVDQMMATPPEDQETVTRLLHDAMAIWFRDLPAIPLVQAPALVPFNTTYWTGWPSAENPWNMPVSWWATFNLVIHGYPDPNDPAKWIGGIKPAGS